MHAPRAVVADTWYADALGLPSLDRVASRPWRAFAGRSPVGRGIALWWYGRRGTVVTTLAGPAPRVLLLACRLTGRIAPQLVLLEFIPVTGSAEREAWRGAPESKLQRLVSDGFWRLVAAPVLRRRLLAAHTLTEWEGDRYAGEFGLPRERFRHIPWFRPDGDEPPPGPAARAGVLASGRAACDWETVFTAAAGAGWPLTVVCSRADEPRVRRLNHDGRAIVRSEIAREDHARLVREAAVYLLALRDAAVSTGQVRIAECAAAGTPVVASDIRGLAGYLEPERTALVFAPGDAAEARAAVDRLYGDETRRTEIAAAARERFRASTRAAYLDAVRALIDCAVASGR